MRDTGDIAHVPEDDRLDDDTGASALDGGADDELDDIYNDPGEIVEDELG